MKELFIDFTIHWAGPKGICLPNIMGIFKGTPPMPPLLVWVQGELGPRVNWELGTLAFARERYIVIENHKKD